MMELAANMSAAMQPLHPMLTQETKAPVGDHFQYSPDWRFPHIDQEENCWQPVAYNPYTDYDGNEFWADYEDPVSEKLREECDVFDWMEVCFTTLNWEQIDCDAYKVEEEEIQSNQESGEDDDDDNGSDSK